VEYGMYCGGESSTVLEGKAQKGLLSQKAAAPTSR